LSALNSSPSKAEQLIAAWMASRTIRPFAFQSETWAHIARGESGLVNAPTGCGKTYAVFIGALIRYIDAHPHDYNTLRNNGLQLLWITPLRALARDIARAMEEVIAALGLPWQTAIRNGDTPATERRRQQQRLPEVLIITPESLHLLLAQKNYPAHFASLNTIAVDEWHELLGSKRGVQTELALSRIIGICAAQDRAVSLWGISATIGNLEEAAEVLLSPLACYGARPVGKLIKADISKAIKISSVYPDEMERYPWAGHLGLKLVHKAAAIIREHGSTLVFINTRGMSERWYQALLDEAPDLAGAIALHHGSIERELRNWVEENLHTGRLKAVVCTASLDLGVDFRPVDAVIQVGSPKGIARFLQRAGRSGHQPDAVSKLYFLPTHALELVEAAALKDAVAEKQMESKIPLLLCFDVLIQYLCTLAVSDGFEQEALFREIRNTYCFSAITREEWNELILFITEGGKSLREYDEYKKVEHIDGRYVIRSRKTAMRHRMHIGTIVSDAILKVKFASGGYLGSIEEYFISKLKEGDVFTLAGRNLELVGIRDMTVLVKKSSSSKTLIPSWIGGRMSLSANLGQLLRQILNRQNAAEAHDEMKWLMPLLDLQQRLSVVPRAHELLVEHIETKQGHHVYVYPFEGRLVHEAMAAILAYRISRMLPITFSIAMNDYGFELLSDRPVPLDDSNVRELFSTENLFTDMQRSVNATEMARRKFRDIAVIGGLIFQGMPGEKMKARHLQSNAGLLFNVFSEYDPDNILLKQAYAEVFSQQMEELRLREAYKRIGESDIRITFPEKITPFCFPIMADGLNRNQLSSEKWEERVQRMIREQTA
jgi:ATP-dependent Lhr-like helicase